ncbi:MAG: riboflavin synthase [Deltaproteobacteria bacterium]|nr:riboflavin synthase [Deltaproteobacteria bacterium]
MFTGIIENAGAVKRITRKGEDALLVIDTSLNLDDIKVGDSIAVNGACLTVTQKTDRSFSADVSAETLARTNLKLLKSGDRVNLEKSLRMNSFLGGHLVLGHVDGLGKIQEKINKANSLQFGLEIDTELGRYIVEKGSVAVDGISLTVNRCEKNRFYVNIIPHTARNTTLEFKKVADLVNIETDIIGKYVEKFLNPGKGIDMNFLAEHGFLK